MAADGDVEFHPVIDVIGLAAAQIPGEAGGAQAGAGKAPFDGLLGRHDADIDGALLEDAVIGQQAFQLVDEGGELLAPAGDACLHPGRQVLGHAARAEIIGVVMRAADLLVHFQQMLALLEAPEGRGDGTAIQRIGGDVEQVVQDAGDFGEQHADILRAFGDIALDAQQSLSGDGEGVLHAHGADVIQPVEIGQRLEIGLVFNQFFGAAVEQADMRIGPFHDLALHLEDEAQHAMRGRVLGAEIDRVAIDLHRVGGELGGGDAHGLGPSTRLRWIFSSPGRVVIASQGLRKSKLRKSWVSFTGS